MKKIAISVVLTIVLAIALAVPVFAESKSVTVNAGTSTDAFEWTIPTSIDIEGTEAGSSQGFNIEVTPKTITPGYGVDVTFTGSQNSFKLVRDGSPATEVGYSLYCDKQEVTNGQAILSDVTEYQYKSLAVTLNDNITVTGNYSDVLGFSATINAIQ